MGSARVISFLWCGLNLLRLISQVNGSAINPAVPAKISNMTTSFQSILSGSVSGDAIKIPVGTVAAAAETASENAAYICSGQEVARLNQFNENNPYLMSGCTNLAGMPGYHFPFNGKLSYAQMIVMSSISQCEYYFRAVLLVQLQECVDANAYIRTTAETILQLANTSGEAPTEAEVNAAIAVRKAYNLALRDGDGSASYFAMSGALSLGWHIEGETIDTTVSASKKGQLLLSPSLHVIGTYYASVDSSFSSSSTPTEFKSAYALGKNISTSTTTDCSSWFLVLVTCATFVLFCS